MAGRPNKPKKAFYALTSSGDFQERPLVSESGSDEESPDPTLAWGQGDLEPQRTPEALRKYPVVDDGVVKVRRIKSKALQREPSAASNHSVQSQDSMEEIPISEGRAKKRVKDKAKVKHKEVEMKPTDFRKNTGRCWGAFSNLSFTDNPEDSVNKDFEDLFLGLAKSVKQTEENMESWEELKQKISDNREQVHQDIEKRKKKLLRRIKEHAQVLHERLDAMIDPRLESAEHQTQTMHDILEEANKLSDGTFLSEHRTHGNVSRSRESLAGLCARLEQGAGPGGTGEAPLWQDVRLVKTENSHQLVTSLFGTIQGGASAPGLAGEALVVEGEEKQKGTGGVLDQPVFLKQFNTKSPKDQRECGITDIAITPSNQILVVDKHNKLVKLFTAEGTLERYIGRGFLKEPSRVSVLRSNGHILVTDVAAKNIRVFHRDGNYLGEFISDLKFPICCAEMYDGKVVVLEYATKSILIYDQSAKPIHSFPTELVTPAYMGCSKNGHIIVTDWRSDVTRIYDVTGARVWECRGPGKGEGEMKQPHGCCGDGHGNVIIAEKGNTRVQIYNEAGDHVMCLSPQGKEGFKLPYSVTTNKCELLAVAEYQGLVKLFRYIDLPGACAQTAVHAGTGHKVRKNKRSYVVPEDVKVESNEETTC